MVKYVKLPAYFEEDKYPSHWKQSTLYSASTLLFRRMWGSSIGPRLFLYLLNNEPWWLQTSMITVMWPFLVLSIINTETINSNIKGGGPLAVCSLQKWPEVGSVGIRKWCVGDYDRGGGGGRPHPSHSDSNERGTAWRRNTTVQYPRPQQSHTSLIIDTTSYCGQRKGRSLRRTIKKSFTCYQMFFHTLRQSPLS